MERDNWGADPQVRYLRQVFGLIEKAQGDFLYRLNISPFDDRLRRWRYAALELFEKTWMLSSKRGVVSEKETISGLYLHCLAHYLKMNRIEVPLEVLPADESMKSLIKEALK